MTLARHISPAGRITYMLDGRRVSSGRYHEAFALALRESRLSCAYTRVTARGVAHYWAA